MQTMIKKRDSGKKQKEPRQRSEKSITKTKPKNNKIIHPTLKACHQSQ